MIEFKLILSIIVGALILSFFIFFAYKHIETSEKLTSVELVNYLDLKLDILSNSLSSYTTFNLGDKNTLNFLCNKLSIDIKNIPYQTPTDKIIASPATLKEKELSIWTKSWSFPFRVTNFYYIANKKINFYIENPELLAKIPNIFNIYPLTNTQEIITKSKTSDKTIVIFSSQPNNLKELLKNNIKVIQILNENQVTFYPESITTNYLGDEMLFLAIFSKDYDTYKCLKQKSIEKLTKISSIYSKEALLLKTKAKQECRFIYDQLASTLTNLPNSLNSELVETQKEELESNACPTFF